MLKHYFIDARLNYVEYDPSSLILYVTEASGFTYEIGHVEDTVFYEFIEQEDPNTYFEDYLLVDNKFLRLNHPSLRPLYD